MYREGDTSRNKNFDVRSGCYLLLLIAVVQLVAEIADCNAFADVTKTPQNQYFLNFPDGIFLSAGQNHHSFAVDLAATPDDLNCDVDLASWSCSVLKAGKRQHVAIVSLEKTGIGKDDQSTEKAEEPTAVLKLTASAQGAINSASTIIRAPESQPRIMQSLQLRVQRNDKPANPSPEKISNRSEKSQDPKTQPGQRYTCKRVGEDSAEAFNGLEIFWLDDKGKVISRNQDPFLDAGLIPSRTKSIKCAALGQRNSSFKSGIDSDLGKVTLGKVIYGVSEAYQLADVFLSKTAGNSDWIIWNSRAVTKTIEFKSLQPLPKGARISCYLGNLLQDRQLKRSVCENAQVASEGQTDFRVTVRLHPKEVAALWEIAERPGTLDRYSPRAINLRVINTGTGPEYFGDRELLVLRTNYAPTLAARQLPTNRVSFSVQDPERDHLIVAAHEKDQKPWQSPASQLWSSWSMRQSPPPARSDLHFEFEVLPGSSCQITASDGVLIATRSCRDSGKNAVDHSSESNHTLEESLLSEELNLKVEWNRSRTGPRSKRLLSDQVARFVSLVTPNTQRATVESLPHEESMRSGFCLGLPGKCDLFLARSGLVEMRTTQRFQAGLWMIGLDFANSLAQLRLLEAFPDSASPIKELTSAKDLAEALSQRARTLLLTKVELTRSSAKDAAEEPLQTPSNLEVVCVSAPELAQTCREIQSMLISFDSRFSTISFQIRSEIKGSRVILGLVKQYQDEIPAEVTGINKPILRQSELRNGLSHSSLIIGNLGKTKEK
jgi:hypothetical protein